MSATPTRPGLLAAALEYHAQGWPSVPVGPDKAACARFRLWFTRRQTAAEVRAFPWDRLHGLALLTWPASELVVLDFDGLHAEQTWKEQTSITLPETATNHTRSGGTHRIYRVPPGTPRPGTGGGADHRRKVRLVVDPRCGCKKPCGVDLLLNGYFIVPPTRGYREDPDHPFEPGNIATIPQAVLSLARRGEGNQTQRTPETTEAGWFAMAMRGPIPEGARNDTATRLAGRLLPQHGNNVDNVVAILEPWARVACVPPMDLRELRETIESVARREQTKGQAPPGLEEQDSPVLVRLSDVQPEPINWFWLGRIARGKLTLLIGDPGMGKSFVSDDIAARASAGAPWPDGGSAPVGDVIILTAEDGKADTVRPRVDVMGGDASRVMILEGIRVAGGAQVVPFNLARDLPHLEKAITQSNAVLVIVDPVSAYLGRIDSKTDAEVRGVLAPLAALAERTGVAVIGIMHLTKDAQRRVISRALGSIGFVAAARAVFLVVADEEDKDRRLFLPVKLNMAQHPPGLAFRLEDVQHTGGFRVGRVAWEAAPVTVNAEDALASLGGPEDRAERRDAGEFLAEFLREGERPAAEVFKAARANGIADRTLKRIKGHLGVKSRHIGQPGEAGAWYWFLPSPAPKGATQPPKGATHPELALFEEPRGIKATMAPISPKSAKPPDVAPFEAETGTLREAAPLLAEVDPW